MLSGQVGAMGVIPGMITAEKYKKSCHGTVVWIPDFLEHKFKYCTMYFFDMGQGGSMTFDLWKGLPEDQRPGKSASSSRIAFDGELMGDAWAQLAKKNGFEVVALRYLWAWGQGLHLTGSSKARPRGGCDCVYGQRAGGRNTGASDETKQFQCEILSRI